MSLYMPGIINVTLDGGRGCCLEHLLYANIKILVARDVDYRAFVKGQGRGVQILLPTRNMTSSYFQRIIEERKKQRKCLVV